MKLKIISLILLLSLLPCGVQAGSFVIDTAGISAEVGKTVQVPVKVSGADDLSGYQLLINTGKTPSAKISVNKESASGMIYSDETGVLIWAGAMRDETIDGDKTLFLLDVTPNTKSPVTISVSVTQTFTGTSPAVQVKNYAGYEAVLKIGENNGEGKEIQPDEPEIEDNRDTQRPVDKDNRLETLPDTEEGFSIPYWILIILASTALAVMIIVTKKR